MQLWLIWTNTIKSFLEYQPLAKKPGTLPIQMLTGPIFYRKLEKQATKEKTMAIFGLGDHITYAGTFVDHIGLLAKELMSNGGVLVGQVPVNDYEFDDSDAVVDDKFLGLPVDEDFEPELTDERVNNWIEKIRPDFGF